MSDNTDIGAFFSQQKKKKQKQKKQPKESGSSLTKPEQEETKNGSQEALRGGLDATPMGQHSVRSSSLINSSKMMSTGVSAFGASTAQTDMMKAMIH